MCRKSIWSLHNQQSEKHRILDRTTIFIQLLGETETQKKKVMPSDWRTKRKETSIKSSHLFQQHHPLYKLKFVPTKYYFWKHNKALIRYGFIPFKFWKKGRSEVGEIPDLTDSSYTKHHFPHLSMQNWSPNWVTPSQMCFTTSRWWYRHQNNIIVYLPLKRKVWITIIHGWKASIGQRQVSGILTPTDPFQEPGWDPCNGFTWSYVFIKSAKLK